MIATVCYKCGFLSFIVIQSCRGRGRVSRAVCWESEDFGLKTTFGHIFFPSAQIFGQRDFNIDKLFSTESRSK